MKKLLFCMISVVLLLSLISIVYAESVPAITLNEKSLTLIQGKTVKLVVSAENVANAKKLKYSWESSDPAVATVQNGVVKGVNEGTAKIICSTTLEDGTQLSASAEITVIVPVKTLKFSSSKVETIYGGKTRRISYTISPDNASIKDLAWSSNNPSVATVDSNGVVTAVSAGKATITAEATDGSRKKAQVQVYVPSITYSGGTVYVNQKKGESFSLDYYGSNWYDVQITKKGDLFDYSINKSGHEITVNILPIRTGRGSLTISDKRDPKSKVSVDINISSNAIPLSQYIIINQNPKRGRNYSLSFTNNTDRDIRYFCFRFVPYDQYGNRAYAKGKAVIDDELGLVVVNDVYNSAGRTIKNWLWYINNISDDAYVQIAVMYIQFSDGEFVYLSDNDMYWFSSLTNQYIGKPNREAKNCYYSYSEWQKYNSYDAGFKHEQLFKEYAARYGYKGHGGYYITSVTDYSIADKAGLMKSDLIIVVDGVWVDNDAYVLEKALARIADGGQFTVTVKRSGQNETIDLVFERHPSED